MQNKHHILFFWASQLSGRVGVDQVGTKSQIFPKIRFEGYPYHCQNCNLDFIILYFSALSCEQQLITFQSKFQLKIDICHFSIENLDYELILPLRSKSQLKIDICHFSIENLDYELILPLKSTTSPSEESVTYKNPFLIAPNLQCIALWVRQWK